MAAESTAISAPLAGLILSLTRSAPSLPPPPWKAVPLSSSATYCHWLCGILGLALGPGLTGAESVLVLLPCQATNTSTTELRIRLLIYKGSTICFVWWKVTVYTGLFISIHIYLYIYSAFIKGIPIFPFKPHIFSSFLRVAWNNVLKQ